MHVLSHTCIQSYGSAVHKRWHHGLALLTLNPGSIMWLFLVDLPYPLWSNDLSVPGLKCCLLHPLVYVQLYNINSDVQKCILRCPRLERRWTTQPGDTGAREIQHDQWSMAIWWNLQIGEFWELGRILWIVKNRLPQSFAHQMAPSLSETIRCWKSKMMERYGMCKMSPQQWIWSSWFLWCSHISPFVPGCKFPTLVRWDRTSMRKRSCVGAWYKIIWKPWSQTDRPVFLMDGWGSNSWPEKLHNLD